LAKRHGRVGELAVREVLTTVGLSKHATTLVRRHFCFNQPMGGRAVCSTCCHCSLQSLQLQAAIFIQLARLGLSATVHVLTLYICCC
jgi:hypothetical protein